MGIKVLNSAIDIASTNPLLSEDTYAYPDVPFSQFTNEQFSYLVAISINLTLQIGQNPDYDNLTPITNLNDFEVICDIISSRPLEGTPIIDLNISLTYTPTYDKSDYFSIIDENLIKAIELYIYRMGDITSLTRFSTNHRIRPANLGRALAYLTQTYEIVIPGLTKRLDTDPQITELIENLKHINSSTPNITEPQNRQKGSSNTMPVINIENTESVPLVINLDTDIDEVRYWYSITNIDLLKLLQDLVDSNPEIFAKDTYTRTICRKNLIENQKITAKMLPDALIKLITNGKLKIEGYDDSITQIDLKKILKTKRKTDYQIVYRSTPKNTTKRV